MSITNSSSRKAIVREIIQRYATFLYFLLLIVTVLFTLNIVAMILGDQPSESYYISIMNFVVLGGTGGAIIVLLWYGQEDGS